MSECDYCGSNSAREFFGVYLCEQDATPSTIAKLREEA